MVSVGLPVSLDGADLLFDVIMDQVDLAQAFQHGGVANLMVFISMYSERSMRRAPASCMPRQFL
jgi:hypothetical protein